MDRRDFLALTASVPLLATPVHADDSPESAQAEQSSDDDQQSGTDTVKIDVRLT